MIRYFRGWLGVVLQCGEHLGGSVIKQREVHCVVVLAERRHKHRPGVHQAGDLLREHLPGIGSVLVEILNGDPADEQRFRVVLVYREVYSLIVLDVNPGNGEITAENRRVKFLFKQPLSCGIHAHKLHSGACTVHVIDISRAVQRVRRADRILRHAAETQPEIGGTDQHRSSGCAEHQQYHDKADHFLCHVTFLRFLNGSTHRASCGAFLYFPSAVCRGTS